jgi:hypothetical protein
MNWTASNDDDINRQGFTVLPDRISAALVGLAARLIDDDFANAPPRTDLEWETCAADTFCKSLVEQGKLNFLATDSGAFTFANQGIGCLDTRLTAQVARRRQGDVGGPHIDGFYPEDDNAVNAPEAVLGIYLTDVTSREDGAFEVWPEARPRVAEWAASLAEVPRRSAGMPALDDLTSGIPLLGPKGMAFLSHGILPHRNAERTATEGYRDAVFFRFYRSNGYRDVLALLKRGGTGW